jgi:hypothetical protein
MTTTDLSATLPAATGADRASTALVDRAGARARLFFVDHMRVALTALVVIHHLTIAFAITIPGLWYYEDATSSAAARRRRAARLVPLDPRLDGMDGPGDLRRGHGRALPARPGDREVRRLRRRHALAGGAYALWDSTLSVGMFLGLLVIFRRWANRTGALWNELSRNAFGVFVLHAPLVVGLTLLLIRVPLQPLLKLLLAIAIALPLCFTVAGLVRRVPGVSRVL